MRAPSIPTTRRGRPYPTDTNLGKIMDHLNMTVVQMAAESGVYHRTLTEYLAGRRELSLPHRVALARALDVKPSLL